ncbi:hypothetical protein L484_016503 [Morus notabilis]|uniref:Uncharacterized protein n=1 Tax=Morus notabilis TaxID=981085 RepID=W9R2A3_9ROSA|nr:hypothetical protein L484_016503 [Morus notabilis]
MNVCKLLKKAFDNSFHVSSQSKPEVEPLQKIHSGMMPTRTSSSMKMTIESHLARKRGVFDSLDALFFDREPFDQSV